MSNEINLDGNIVSVLMGRQCQAKYIDPEIESYKGNPLIEALPPIKTLNEVSETILNLPLFSEEDIEKPPEKRIHYVEQIRDYMQPLPIHIQIESTLSLMIRRGYLGRNPLSPFYARQFAVGIKDIMEKDLDLNGENLIGNKSTAKSYSVIGISGIGKTTAVETTLLMYPQVITHSKYQKNGLTLGYLKQIVWLKLECPFNGSRKSFCQQFFLTVDQILQTNYYHKFVNSRTTEEELITKMAHICSLHCVGVLAIDEIQRMKKGEEAQKMLDFFVELSTKLGVPLLYIGTYKAIPMFSTLLANGRRASGMGAEFMDPMKQDRQWNLFLQDLWEYQWTKTKVPLTEDLNNAMYELTQGVTDFVINLFIKSQQYAIAYGNEKLTVSLIRKVAIHNLRLVQDIIDALRSGERKAIEKYDDLSPGWVETNNYIEALGVRIGLHGKISDQHKRARNVSKSKENFKYLVTFAMNFDLSETAAVKIVTKAMETNKGMLGLDDQQVIVTQMILDKAKSLANKNEVKEKKQKKVAYFPSKKDVRLIEKNAKKDKVSIVQALKEEGIVKPFTEFLY